MAEAYRLQDPGEGIHEASITEVKVSPGDTVEEGDVLLAVETDKAEVEVPSPFSGTVETVEVAAGDAVRVGDVLLTYVTEGGGEGEGGGEDDEAGGAEEEQREKETQRGQEKRREKEKPRREETQREEEKQRREETQRGEEKKAAKVKERPREQGAKQEKKETKPGEKPGARREPHRRDERPVPAAPATRRLARELGVDLSTVEPSGPGGRVIDADVRATAGQSSDETAAPSPPEDEERARDRAEQREQSDGKATAAGGTPRSSVPASPELPDFAQWGEVERIPLDGVRRTTARRMAVAWTQIPHVLHEDSVDVTELEAFRQEHKEDVRQRGGRLTLTALVMKVLVGALKRFPRFNASIDVESEEIVLKHYYHIGVAVATDRGLLVPKIRDVDRKSITELAVELTGLAERTRKGEIDPSEMRGGTFTLTNPGPLGGARFMPIINYPEAAILGLARARFEPVVAESRHGHEIKPRLMLPLCLAFDHRINDGADAARFVSALIEGLGDIESFILAV